MELQQKEKPTTKRSDWCKALSYYSDDQKICRNCQILKNQLSYFVLPIDKASKKLEDINLKAFSKALTQKNIPVIFKGIGIENQKPSLIYLEPEANINKLLKLLSFKEEVEKPFATIVSPSHYSKSKRENETLLVREIQKHFDPTGFIKLPLNSIDELIAHSVEEGCDMLILPFSKLTDYLIHITEKPAAKTLPAAFYPSFC